jgi:uncharacterized membrane protein/ketosteroid isomerase-like protein
VIEIIPNWHPIWVHFAIALLICGTVIYTGFGWKAKSNSTEPTHPLIVSRWMLWLGVFASLATLLTGYWASITVAHDDLAHANMLVHRNWAIGATAIFVIGAGWEFLRRTENKASVLSAALFLAGSAALLVTGMEGAENVYEHGLGVKRLPEVSGHDHSHADSNKEKSDSIEPGEDGHSHAHATSDARPSPRIDEAVFDHPAVRVAESMNSAIGSGNTDDLKRLLDQNVVIFESGNVESSLAEYQSHHMKSDIAFMAAMNVELLSREVIDAGDSATVISRSRISGQYKGKEINLVNTETLVIQKRNRDWKVVHVHWSSS